MDTGRLEISIDRRHCARRSYTEQLQRNNYVLRSKKFVLESSNCWKYVKSCVGGELELYPKGFETGNMFEITRWAMAIDLEEENRCDRHARCKCIVS